MHAAADALTRAMLAEDLVGERVALMLPNGAELVICYLACFRSGSVATPMNARYAPPELERALKRAGPRWLVVHADRLAALGHLDPATLAGVRVIVVGGPAPAPWESYGGVLHTDAPASEPGDFGADAPAIIFFTSGSTGRPKGVVHDRGSTEAILTSTSEALGDVRSDDIVQVFEPLVHVSGFIATFTGLRAGATVILYDGFDIEEYARALRAHRPTLVSTHVDVLAQLLSLPGARREWFSSLRGVYTGGDTVPAAVHLAFAEVSGLPISVGYGMTEAIWLTVQREARTERDGCIGRPVGGARLRVDEATGELMVAGPMVMQRYWDDEALTAETLVDDWLHTGDTAQVDADGTWWFTGRIKDVIVRRTSKITPGEVEAALEQHPSVALAAVIGVPEPHEGHIPVAFVVPRQGAVTSPEELTAFLAQRIAAYKLPSRINLRTSLPLTASGKIARKELRE